MVQRSVRTDSKWRQPIQDIELGMKAHLSDVMEPGVVACQKLTGMRGGGCGGEGCRAAGHRMLCIGEEVGTLVSPQGKLGFVSSEVGLLCCPNPS